MSEKSGNGNSFVGYDYHDVIAVGGVVWTALCTILSSRVTKLRDI